jgi:hypothetical protein
MARFSIVALAAVSAALALAPSGGSAQVPGGLRGPFIGVGVGLENLRDPGRDDQRFGAMLHARAGIGLGSVAPMLEVGFRGLGDDEPSIDDVVIITAQPVGEPIGGLRKPSMLSTISVLASVQVGLPGAFHVRPGVGLGSHAFPVYNLFGTDTPVASTSHEAGLAAGLALGRTMNVAGRFPVAIEAVGLWSGGEDSTGSRWAAGVQVVPMIRF